MTALTDRATAVREPALLGQTVVVLGGSYYAYGKVSKAGCSTTTCGPATPSRASTTAASARRAGWRRGASASSGYDPSRNGMA